MRTTVSCSLMTSTMPWNVIIQTSIRQLSTGLLLLLVVVGLLKMGHFLSALSQLMSEMHSTVARNKL